MEDLAQHILDIAFNSVEAGATELEINMREDLAANVLEFTVQDNGNGISPGDISKVLDPFFTTKENARIGLGLSLLKETVEGCDGVFQVESHPGKGTLVKAVCPHDHWDRLPLGDIAGTLVTLVTGNERLEIVYRHRFNDKTFFWSTLESKLLLKEVPLQSPPVLAWLGDYLEQRVRDLRRVKDEKFGRVG